MHSRLKFSLFCFFFLFSGMDLAAFSVTLDHHLTVPGGTSVLYNHILVDNMDSYNVTSGVYTVPSSGIYLFHVFR